MNKQSSEKNEPAKPARKVSTPQLVRGMHDILPSEWPWWNYVYDTLEVGFTDSFFVNDTTKAFRFVYSSLWLNFKGFCTKRALTLEDISINDSYKIVIGEKKNGFFKKAVPIVQITNDNPYMKVTGMNNIIVQTKPKFYQTGIFAFGIGGLLGLAGGYYATR